MGTNENYKIDTNRTECVDMLKDVTSNFVHIVKLLFYRG